MKYTKRIRDKHGLLEIKKGKSKYYEIEKHQALRCACSLFKVKHGIIFHVNKVVDEKNNDWVAVTRA